MGLKFLCCYSIHNACTVAFNRLLRWRKNPNIIQLKQSKTIKNISHAVTEQKDHNCLCNKLCLCCRLLHDCDDIKLDTEWSSSAAHTWDHLSCRVMCTLLVSPVLPSHTFIHCCLMQILMFVYLLYLFRYWLPAGPSDILAVHVLRSGELGDALWQRSGAPSSGWEVAEVTVSSPAKFHVSWFLQRSLSSHTLQIKLSLSQWVAKLLSENVYVLHQVVFKSVYVPGTNSTVKLDDISVRDGVCSPPGSCDFESGQCTWVNVPKEDGHDWVLASGGFQGPPTDHTTQTPEGTTLDILQYNKINM